MVIKVVSLFTYHFFVNDRISNQKGKRGKYLRDKKGRKKYGVLEGKKALTTPTHSETYSTVVDWSLIVL